MFTSTGQGSPGISLKDLETGKQSELPPSGLPAQYPKISPDGKRIAYAVARQNGPVLHIAQVGSAQPEMVSEACVSALGLVARRTVSALQVGSPAESAPARNQLRHRK